VRSTRASENLFFGFDFRVDQNNNFLQGIPENSESIGDPFKLDEIIDPTSSDIEDRKFSVGFQGGSDGQSIYREIDKGKNISKSNTFGFSFDGKNSGGQDAYRRAFRILSEVEGGYDFNLLTTPELDIKNHLRTVREATEMVEGRGDVFYVFDGFEFEDHASEVQRPTLNSTYTATYFGWVRPIVDNFDFVPSSAIIPQTYSQNDRIKDPWFSPAGVRRGEIPRVETTKSRLSEEELNRLYELQINPVKFSETNGVLLLGNKTLSADLETLLSSIDVRRTLVFLISSVRQLAQDYLFEQSTAETSQNFRIDIIQVLSTLQDRNAIREYEVEVSNPEESRRRPNSLVASVSVIPQPSSEYIALDFVIEEQSIQVIT
jgi:hypothetical protein